MEWFKDKSGAMLMKGDVDLVVVQYVISRISQFNLTFGTVAGEAYVMESLKGVIGATRTRLTVTVVGEKYARKW